MECHISFRNVTWTEITGGFTVTVITDVPSHVYIRWSLAEPQIHSRAVLRRGYAFSDDVRFCFTVFTDKEQNEVGDTLTHTFTLIDWPGCQTRYFYFWGSMAGQTCVSTSGIFKLHKPLAPYEPPPYPYTGTWYFYPFMTSRPNGELEIGLGSADGSQGIIYRSLDYGDTWLPYIRKADVGVRPMYYRHMRLLHLIIGANKIVYSSPSALPGTWTARLQNITSPTLIFATLDEAELAWVGYWYRTGGYSYQIAITKDCGLTWQTCFNTTLSTPVAWGQITINPTLTKGIAGTSGLLVAHQARRSDNPTSTPGTWTTMIYIRTFRFGMRLGHAFFPYEHLGNTFRYTDNYGLTTYTKPVPIGMQGDIGYGQIAADSSPFWDFDLITAVNGNDKGVWLSRDRGDSWHKVLGDLGQVVAPYLNGVKFDQYRDGYAYAWGKNGFFRSKDEGETWKACSNGLELEE